jgi:hypothetical protein
VLIFIAMTTNGAGSFSIVIIRKAGKSPKGFLW